MIRRVGPHVSNQAYILSKRKKIYVIGYNVRSIVPSWDRHHLIIAVNYDAPTFSGSLTEKRMAAMLLVYKVNFGGGMAGLDESPMQSFPFRHCAERINSVCVLPNELGYNMSTQYGHVALITEDGRVRVVNLDTGAAVAIFTSINDAKFTKCAYCTQVVHNRCLII